MRFNLSAAVGKYVTRTCGAALGALVASSAFAGTDDIDLQLNVTSTTFGMFDAVQVIKGGSGFQAYTSLSGGFSPNSQSSSLDSSGAIASTTLNYGMQLSSDNSPTGLLAIGLVRDFASSDTHVAMYMGRDAATFDSGVAWGSISPTISEQSIINDLLIVGSGSVSLFDPTFRTASRELYSFATGLSASSWIDLSGITSAPTTTLPLSMMEWSSGQSVGGGTINATYTAPVPEPGTYALLLAGLGVLGVAARRRAPSVHFA